MACDPPWGQADLVPYLVLLRTAEVGLWGEGNVRAAEAGVALYPVNKKHFLSLLPPSFSDLGTLDSTAPPLCFSVGVVGLVVLVDLGWQQRLS